MLNAAILLLRYGMIEQAHPTSQWAGAHLSSRQTTKGVIIHTVAQPEFRCREEEERVELLIVSPPIAAYLNHWIIKTVFLMNAIIMLLFWILESTAMLEMILLKSVYCIRVGNAKCTSKLTQIYVKIYAKYWKNEEASFKRWNKYSKQQQTISIRETRDAIQLFIQIYRVFHSKPNPITCF